MVVVLILRFLIPVSLLLSVALCDIQLSTNNFETSFANDSGVLKSLKPSVDSTFDFSPSDVFHLRNENGQYHTGDLIVQFRAAGEAEWSNADTAALRQNVTILSSKDGSLVSSNINAALHNCTDSLNVTRTWRGADGDLALQFTLTSIASTPVEIGALGFPIEFNNIFTNRTDITQKCVLVDPYIGLNAGYLQVTRLTGTGPNLVITPLNHNSKFEAWEFLSEPYDEALGYQIQTFEGNYAWHVFTKSLSETEWKDADPWNTPTSTVLEPGESIAVGLRFAVAKQVQDIESVVAEQQPVAVGIPGYVIPRDLTAKLFLKSAREVKGVAVSPAKSLRLNECGTDDKIWTGYNIAADPGAFGRVRLVIEYMDGTLQAVHYWIAHPSPTALSQFGNFLTTDQWFTNASDPFGRSPSVITFDRSTADYVSQENRTWIAGLSDEGGAGSFLAAGMKQSVWPDQTEAVKLEQMVDGVVWGNLQATFGNETYSVKRSLFFYQPNLVPGYTYDSYFNWSSIPFPSQDKEAAYATDRTYNYVHVSALYWGLYRAGRTHPEVLTKQTPDWYLLQAYHTVAYSVSNSTSGVPHTGYWSVGLMVEWVWGFILSDLYAENYTTEADHLKSLMKARQDLWAGLVDPFGSEMAWDSTGEEGVYYWSQYFGDHATAMKSVNAIRGYMPTIPHWGWNGNARRYWDFVYAGEPSLARIERQIHHYGSGLNALPILDNYRRSPFPESLEAMYTLRVGYGGNQGPLSNIDAGGFGAMAFHSYPDTLRWDAYSGDYGPNFAGHVMGAATYLVEHPAFGWVSFGGNLQYTGNGVIIVEPKDAARKRVFVANVSLYIELDAGQIAELSFDPASKKTVLHVVRGSGGKEQATLTWQQTAQVKAHKMNLVTSGLERRLDGWKLVLPATITFEQVR